MKIYSASFFMVL